MGEVGFSAALALLILAAVIGAHCILRALFNGARSVYRAVRRQAAPKGRST